MDAVGTLYVVATPIGNMDDLSLRALSVLSAADIVAAEDTRVSGLMLGRLGVKAKLVSCHKFNEASRLSMLGDALLSGKNVALISDAGTPCVSDPGYLLAAHAVSLGVEVVGIPGPCAAVTAVSVSGFDAREFTFLGFLPRERAALLRKLEAFGAAGGVAVFYESPQRIIGTLTVLGEALPDARVCACNDLTKKFERVYRGSVAEVARELKANPNSGKGEYTCVVECDAAPVAVADEASIEARLVDIIVKEGLTVKDAVSKLNDRDKALGKRNIYAAALRLKDLL